MTDWKKRMKEDLEPVLQLPDPRPKISAYDNMPYAIFQYPPEEEFAVRAEISMLQIRLELSGKKVTRISLAECMAAESVMGQALPDVFDRFEEAAARVKRQDLDSLMTTENLRGLTPVFASLDLLRDEGGKAVFKTEADPLAEVLAKIKNRTDYGENAAGKYLESEFSKEPFGWDFDVVRILTVCLLRTGAIEATSRGQLIESALSVDAKNTFSNNNLFRQTSFRPKEVFDFTELIKANENVKDVFGGDIPDLSQSVAAETIREKAGKREKEVQDMYTILVGHHLPGSEILGEACDLIRAIRTGSEEQTILTFNSACKELKEAVKRTAELAHVLTEPAQADIKRAGATLTTQWPFLAREPDLDEAFKEKAETLKDLLDRETFFRELPTIDQHARELEKEYGRRFAEASAGRKQAYAVIMEDLEKTPGWEKLTDGQKKLISDPIDPYVRKDPELSTPIPQLRADCDAAPERLNRVVEDMMRILDGNRVVKVNAAGFFAGGVETEEQLDAALQGLREACESHIGAGKKVLIQ